MAGRVSSVGCTRPSARADHRRGGPEHDRDEVTGQIASRETAGGGAAAERERRHERREPTSVVVPMRDQPVSARRRPIGRADSTSIVRHSGGAAGAASRRHRPDQASGHSGRRGSPARADGASICAIDTGAAVAD